MEARRYCATLVLAAPGLVFSSHLFAAGVRTANFMVTAPSPDLAQEVARAAEQFRRDLAIEWIGQELPRWAEPCPIEVQVGPHLGAGGATSFMFDRGRPFGWRMQIQGSRERLLDSVLPHEVTHTIFATYFGRPLPRWADEGACTSVEHVSEKAKQEQMLKQFLRSNPSRGIPFNRMFAMKEYPADIMPLYSQGFSLVRFLLDQGGKQKFIQYVADGLRHERWDDVTEQHYGFRDLSELQLAWVDWVAAGSPGHPDRSQIAATEPRFPASDSLVALGPRVNGAGRSQLGGLSANDGLDQQNLAGRDTRDPAVALMAVAGQSDSEMILRGQNSSTSESWYARQRDKIRGKSIFSVGGSAGKSRIAFSSFASLDRIGKSFSQPAQQQLIATVRPVFDLDDPVPLPAALQAEADDLLEQPFAPHRPVNSDFYRQEQPLSAGGTVWR
jgi:hypothetical protein